MNLLKLIKQYRKLIILAFSLVIIEDVAWVVEPYIFGKVIDAVIDVQIYNKEKEILSDTTMTEEEKKIRLEEEELTLSPEYTEEYNTGVFDSIKVMFKEDIGNTILFPLTLWIIAFAINSGVGTLRRSLDPKIFLKIYTKIAEKISRVSVLKNISISKTTARIDLSQQFINFMQFRVPELIENGISISGAIIALYFFDWVISLTCLCIIFPMHFANRIYLKKVSVLQKEYHDNYEDIVDVLAKRDSLHVREYFNRLAEPQKKIANCGAFNFGVMRITLMIIFLVVLYVAINLDNFTAGELYSIVAYLWTFVTATEYLPELLENWTSIKDISRRLKSDN
jgi:ABC-type multidrug transport system fused ATPase/permease subunit